MSLPKFPTKNQIAKLSRAEVEERLRKMGEKPPTLRCWADDPDDNFLTVDKSKPKCSCDNCRYKASPLELKKFPLLSHAARRLHKLPYERWVDGLSLKEVQAELRELKIELSMWERRSMGLQDLRKRLRFALPQLP